MAIVRIGLGNKEEVYELGVTTSIGRDESSSIQIVDPMISRSHLVIRRMPNGHYLCEDVGSRHGTFIAGKRIIREHLRDGDEIQIGSTLIRFETDEALVEDERDSADIVVMRRRAMDEEPTFRVAKDYAETNELRHDFERLRVAYEVSRAIGALTELDGILEAILDAAFQLLAADRGAVLLGDESGKLQLRLSRRVDGSKERVVVSTSLLREVMETKTGVVCADAGQDARFGQAASIQAQALRSTMTVPLLYKDEILGVLHLDSQTAYGLFGEKDLELFASIAGQAAIAIKSAYLARQALEEARQREQFQRFLPPSLVDQLMCGEMELGTGGTLREVTVLFLDIRGFTRLSETEEPEAIVEMLNHFFETMLEVLFRHRGTFDKYIGDEIMALFGVPVSMPDAADHAVACALDMQRALVRLNAERGLQGKAPISIGIGIHTGPAVCGAIGSVRTMQYTAIGDTVNTAARLCSAARPDQLLVSASTASKLSRGFVVSQLSPVELKGKRKPVAVVEVLDEEEGFEDLTAGG